MAFRVEKVLVPPGTATLVLEAQAGDLEFWADVNQNMELAGSESDAQSSATRTGPSALGGFPLNSQIRPGDQIWGFMPSGSGGIVFVIRSA